MPQLQGNGAAWWDNVSPPGGRMAGSWALYLKLELDAETSIQELGRERPDDDPHAG